MKILQRISMTVIFLFMVNTVSAAGVYCWGGKYVDYIKNKVVGSIENIIEGPIEEQVFDNTIQSWNNLVNDYYDVLSRYYFEDTDEDCYALASFISQSILKNPQLYHVLLSFCVKSLQSDKQLTPYEEYLIQKFLNTCHDAELFTEDQKLLNQLPVKSLFLQDFMNPKEDIASNAFVNKKMSILNANIKKLQPYNIEEIFVQDADVICLEDVFSDEMAYTLYKELKVKYNYFYTTTSADLSSLTLPRGLFIASKCPIGDVQHVEEDDHLIISNFTVKNSAEISMEVYAINLQYYRNDDWKQENILRELAHQAAQKFFNGKGEAICYFCGDFQLTPYFANGGNYMAMVHEDPNLICFNFEEKRPISVSIHFDVDTKSSCLVQIEENGDVKSCKSNREMSVLKSSSAKSFKISKTSGSDSNNSDFGGYVDVFGKADSDGNSSAGAEVGATYNHETDSGVNFDASVDAKGSVDSNGNVSGEVEVQAGINF